jgi:hypothetical protein
MQKTSSNPSPPPSPLPLVIYNALANGVSFDHLKSGLYYSDKTALHLCAEQGHAEICWFLIASKADLDAKDVE